MDRLDRLEIARRDGFLHWPGLFDPGRVEALRGRVLPFAEEFRPRRGLAYDDPDFVRLQCEVTVLEEFDSSAPPRAVARFPRALARRVRRAATG